MPSSNMGHVGLTNRSPGQILENCVNTLEATFLPDFDETWPECLS